MGRVCMVRDLVAELVMGRVCYGPSLSWAEFVMGRDVPESKHLSQSHMSMFLYVLTQTVIPVYIPSAEGG